MIRTDDTAPLHSKFQLAGLAAYGFWHAALSYCGRQLTDGFIAARSLPAVFPSATPDERLAAIEALVREGCLHRVEAGQRSPCGRRRSTCPTKSVDGEGWILHDYFAYQERAETARLRRRILSQAGRKGGIASQKKQQAEASSLGPSQPPPPIRSVPFRSDPEEKDLKKTRGVDVVNWTEPKKQPSASEQLAALAQINGTTPDQLAADARALVARTTASLSRR